MRVAVTGRTATAILVATPHPFMTDSDDDPEGRTTIRPGRNFEREYRLSTEEAGRFLIDLGNQLRDGEELTIKGDDWELPFAFGEPAELEIEFEGVGDEGLEIELELVGRPDESGPDVR